MSDNSSVYMDAEDAIYIALLKVSGVLQDKYPKFSNLIAERHHFISTVAKSQFQESCSKMRELGETVRIMAEMEKNGKEV